jgi:D-3-phosphoglycerate dehydrogenase / 2-oxoglutarate reductase
MRLRIEAPTKHLEHVLKEFDVKQVARGSATVLIPDPTKTVNLSNYPKLKLIVTPSTGTNHIPLNICNELGIKVVSLLDNREALDEIRASSEWAFFMILSGLRLGGWRQWQKYDRQPEIMRGRELYKKHVGIVGFGRIGQNVARWLDAFGATWESYDYGSSDETLRGLFSNCDIVLISCNLNDKSRGMIKAEHLDLLKDNAVLVNIARGEIIDERALLNGTEKGRFVYVADVLHGEVDGNVATPLLSRPNCIIYPHLGGVTVESEEKALRIALTLAQKEM